jgi:hypothetical protein
MFIVIHYTEKRIILLKYSTDLDESIEYFIRNTGSDRKEITKKMISYGYYEKSNIYILETNHNLWTSQTIPYYIKTPKIENITNFIKLELRNIMIDKIIK